MTRSANAYPRRIPKHAARKSATPANSAGKRLDIQGLRCVAVALVIIFHAGVAPLEGGFVGVDVFFVISGFLITGIITRQVTSGTFSIPGFWANRARRLLPAAFVAITTTCLLTYLILPGNRFDSIAKDGLASAYYGVNWRFANQAVNYLAMDQAPSPFQHFWSLSVEEQFYLAWPLLLAVAGLLIARRGKHTKLAFAVALAVVFVPSLLYSISYTASNAARAYFVTPTRMWELALGGGVALAMTLVKRVPAPVAALLGWGGLALIGYSAFAFDGDTPFPGSAALIPTVGAAAVLAFGEQAGTWGPGLILRLRPFTFIGDISYSLYLWHWPLIVLASYYFYDDVVLARPMLLVGFGAIIPAYLSYRFIERPALNSEQFAGNFAGLRLGFLASAASIVAALLLLTEVPTPHTTLVVQANGRAENSTGQVVKIGAETLGSGKPLAVRPAADEGITPDPITADKDRPDGGKCIQGFEKTAAVACDFGDTTSSTLIALVGDSHAMQWLPALDVAAQNYHWHLVVYTKDACPFAESQVVLSGQAYHECTTWTARVEHRLRQRRPALVVTSGRPYRMIADGNLLGERAGADALADGYQRVWHKLAGAGIPVAVIADTPRPGYDVVGCVEKHTKSLGTCERPRATTLDVGTGLERAVQRDHHVHYVDLTSKICPAKMCAPVIGNVLVYRDKQHLTATYSATLADDIGVRVAKYASST